MTSPLNEAAVEQAAIDWLKGLGWQYAYGPDIGPEGATPERESYGQVVLEQRLRDALAEINPAAPHPSVARRLPAGDPSRGSHPGTTQPRLPQDAV